MKGALLLVALGALLAIADAGCPVEPYYACVRAERPKKCTAIEVCAKPVKEKCGNEYCSYPYTCASSKKTICKNFLALKKRCDPIKVCKEVKKPCGYGYCNLHEDCIKETYCAVKKGYHGRRLMGAEAKSVAVAKNGGHSRSSATAENYGGGNAKAESGAYAEDYGYADSDAHAKSLYGGNAESYSKAAAKKGGRAHSKADSLAAFGGHARSDSGAYSDGGDAYSESKAVSFGTRYTDDYYTGYGYDYGYDPEYGFLSAEKRVCKEKYACVANHACQDVIVHKCVEDYLRPGYDVCHGGYDFDWYGNVGEQCGADVCGAGYKCAAVIIKKCQTPCGADYCGYGYECVAAEDPYCKDYAYLETVCKDVYEPTCVPLTPYCLTTYKPPCKTIYKCEEEVAACGNTYCEEGYVCAVDYKKKCDPGYGGPYGPVKYVKKEKDPKRYFPSKSKAIAVSKSKADPYGTSSESAGYAEGNGVAGASGAAYNDDSSAESDALAKSYD